MFTLARLLCRLPIEQYVILAQGTRTCLCTSGGFGSQRAICCLANAEMNLARCWESEGDLKAFYVIF